MRNSFGWAEPRPEQNIIFWFHREQKRGIPLFTEQHWHLGTFCFWGSGSLKKVVVWRCFSGLFLLWAVLWPLLSPFMSLLECLCSHCPHPSGGGDCTAMGAITAWPRCSELEPNLLSPRQRSYYRSNLYSFSRASQWLMTDNCSWAPVRRCAINNLAAKWCLKKWRNGLGGF